MSCGSDFPSAGKGIRSSLAIFEDCSGERDYTLLHHWRAVVWDRHFSADGTGPLEGGEPPSLAGGLRDVLGKLVGGVCASPAFRVLFGVNISENGHCAVLFGYILLNIRQSNASRVRKIVRKVKQKL